MAGHDLRIIYRTATSLDGFIADSDNSLTWLFAVEGGDAAADPEIARFMEGVTVLVEGSTTYEWVLAETGMLDHPEKWQGYYGDRPTYVFTSRRPPVPDGADVRFVSGPVAGVLPEIRAAAAGGDIWVVGGGDLAGQFFDAGALDEVVVTIAPVTLGAGAPLLPRRIESSRLRLRSTSADGQLLTVHYAVNAA